MNRLLIVDDEHHIVNWLAELFESCTELDLEIMKAYSGYETLQLLENYKMDIILLDIQMPGISGLEVAEKALTDWPSTRIIFLTAHKNFDFLYRANQFPQTSYLLKTEEDENIVAHVKMTLEQIQNEIKRHKHLEKAKAEKMLLEHLLEQETLKKLAYGTNEMAFFSSTRTRENGTVTIDPLQPVYLMYIQIPCERYQHLKESSSDTVLTCLEAVAGFLQNTFRFSMLELEKNIMLWFFQDNRPNKNETTLTAVNFLRNISEDIVMFIEKSLNNTAISILYDSIVMPKNVSYIVQMLYQYGSEQFHQTVQFSSSSTVISVQNLEKNTGLHSSNHSIDAKSIAQELSFYLSQKDKNAYMSLLHTAAAQCVSCKSMHDLSVVDIYFSIALILIRYISQHKLEKQLALKTALYPLYFIRDFSDWKSAFDYLTALSEHIFIAASNMEKSQNEQLILTMEKYIAQNIAQPLSISDVASCINYNAAYASRLYKQVRGISLSNYITDERLRKATDLLLTTNESIQNIAQKTGFDTSQYFSIVFKKKRGISPRDFRNRHLSQS